MRTFLFVTANLYEKAAFEKYYKRSAEKYIKGKIYYLGQFGRYSASYIHIDEQGQTNSASTPLVGELIRILNPVAVVMVGIAFGANENNQKIGDVLVSKRILPYDAQKILEKSTYYKETPKDVGFQLLNGFSNFEDWNYYLDDEQKSKVFVGSMLTGSRLINNYQYRSKLLRDFTEYEPIGGEMEAFGIYSVCKIHGVTEWIIVKSICDWGYKKNNPNKEHDQENAANAAVDFCYHVFSRDKIFGDLIEQVKEDVELPQINSKFTTINNGHNINQKISNIEINYGNINF